MDGRLLLCYFICMTSCLVAGQSPKYALKGGKVLLLPDIAGHPDGILWKHNGNKVAEFNGQEQEVYHPYENRITLGWASAELDITDLRFEDSGDYELEVDINKGLHRSLYKLQVIDKVANPTISCEMNDGGSSNISGNLVCSAEPRRPQSLIKFEWTTRGIIQPGPNLQISLGDQHDDEEYSCNVSNPLSSETATFTANDCYPDKSSSVPLIAIGVIVPVLLLVGLAILYRKLCHKGPKETHDEESRPLVHRTSTLPSTQRLPQLDQDCTGTQDEQPKEGHVSSIRKKFEPNHHRRTLQRGSENNTDEHKETASPLRSEFQDLNKHAINDKGDADADQYSQPAGEEVPQSNPSDTEKENGPDHADVLDDSSEDTQSGPQVTFSSEKPGYVSSIRKKFEPNHHRRTSQRGDADADQQREPTEVPQSDPSDSEEKNDPDPPSVRDDLSEDTESSPQVPISSEQPGSENNTDEHKEMVSPLRTEFPIRINTLLTTKVMRMQTSKVSLQKSHRATPQTLRRKMIQTLLV
ncbi:uncharacterized protein LOC129116440, partial [Anoplopoma fimbria]|uniref:uncharacterized protein LOC129116440 n=1 Tax=Anoplopoma fimbria TaxID=229290 RepID=UPI0023ED03EF